MDLTEFTVDTGSGKLSCTLASPDKKLRSEASGLLLHIGGSRQVALQDPAQNHPTVLFLEAGHYVLSFDLPHHGGRVQQYGEKLVGMSQALIAGDDPFEQFVSDGVAALDWCLHKDIGTNGKLVAYGISRAGYCCLRLAAADARVRAVAAVSPVTDWAILTEFSQCNTSHLRIERWVDQLADKAVYLCIGSQDERVGVAPCVHFGMKLFEKQQQALPESILFNQLHVVDFAGHSPAMVWRLDAARYLLRFFEKLSGDVSSRSPCE